MTLKPFLGEKPRLYCNSCSSHTWHKIVFETTAAEPIDEDEPDNFTVDEHWKVLQCLGCEHLSLVVLTDFPWDSEQTIQYFPTRNATFHVAKSYDKLPATLVTLYKEVVSAFNMRLILLCAAGLRTLLEAVCSDRGILEGPNAHGKLTRNLEGRINGLSSVVPSTIVAHLHGFRFLGNRALHELDAPKLEDLTLALAVVEDILNVVYDLNYRSELFFKKASIQKQTSEPEDDESKV